MNKQQQIDNIILQLEDIIEHLEEIDKKTFKYIMFVIEDAIDQLKNKKHLVQLNM